MSPTFTREQILALAPDAQVAQTGQSLAQPAKWQDVGEDRSVAWGYHQGSGSTPYQVAIDYNGPALKCSCPSRKRPCKHALGLFLLLATHPEVAVRSDRPGWVQEWSAGRAKRADQVDEKPREADDSGDGTPAAVGEEGTAKRTSRQSQREKRVQEGVSTLGRWLEDTVRQGLANVPRGSGSEGHRSAGPYEIQAARLVDAQAPGLARRLREMASIPLSGEGWPGRLLDRLGSLNLLLQGYERVGSLPPDLQQEIRSQIGWNQDQESLRSQSGERDRWLVVGRRLTEEDRLRVQRTWLWGTNTRIGALVLDFAPPGRPLESSLMPGTCLDAELVFWAGATRQRALVKAQNRVEPMRELPGYAGLGEALAAYGAAIAANPWLGRFLMPLSGVIPLRQGDRWLVRDDGGQCMPFKVAQSDGWRLLALSGGRPLSIACDWDGESLDPMSVWTGKQLIPLTGGESSGGQG